MNKCNHLPYHLHNIHNQYQHLKLFQGIHIYQNIIDKYDFYIPLLKKYRPFF